MGLPRFACVAIAAFSLFPGFIMTGFAASPQDKSITLAVGKLESTNSLNRQFVAPDLPSKRCESRT